MPSSPLFLARAVYRRRRLRDAARLLPLLGFLLMLLPAMGQSSGGDAAHSVYLFLLWAALIAAAAVLAPHLSKSEADGEPEGEGQALPLEPHSEPDAPPPQDTP